MRHSTVVAQTFEQRECAEVDDLVDGVTHGAWRVVVRFTLGEAHSQATLRLFGHFLR